MMLFPLRHGKVDRSKPKRIDRALDALDTSRDGELDIDEWEEAIYRGLAKRVEHLGEERERRERAARAEDEAFTIEFLMAARQVYDVVDEDGSGSLNKDVLVKAVNDADAIRSGVPAPAAAPVVAAPTVVQNVDESGQVFYIDTATGEKTNTMPAGATVMNAAAIVGTAPTSEPASGSVSIMVPPHRRSMIAWAKRRFCSSVPRRSITRALMRLRR